jgi:hypothetical protein
LLAGDRVTWTHVTQSGRSMTFRVREGKVVSHEGDVVRVKYRGELINMRRDRVRRVGERNELTEFVCGKANAGGESPAPQGAGSTLPAGSGALARQTQTEAHPQRSDDAQRRQITGRQVRRES